MPRYAAWPLALLSVSYGIWLARFESRRPSRQLVWPIEGTPMLDGLELMEASLKWRGSLAFLQWRNQETGTGRLAWWPDTLPPRSRRELRLAAASSVDTRPAASMAP